MRAAAATGGLAKARLNRDPRGGFVLPGGGVLDTRGRCSPGASRSPSPAADGAAEAAAGSPRGGSPRAPGGDQDAAAAFHAAHRCACPVSAAAAAARAPAQGLRSLLPLPFPPLCAPRGAPPAPCGGTQRSASPPSPVRSGRRAAPRPQHRRSRSCRRVLNAVNQHALASLLAARPRCGRSSSPASPGRSEVHAVPPLPIAGSSAGGATARSAAGLSGASVDALPAVRQARIEATSRTVATQAAVLDRIKRSTQEGGEVLALAGAGVRDIHAGILGSVLGCHPSLAMVDLSGNPNLGDVAARALAPAVAESRHVVRVSLEGTAVTQPWRDAIDALCARNAERIAAAKDEAARRRIEREEQGRARVHAAEAKAMLAAEREARRALRQQRSAQAAELHAACCAAVERQRRAERRAQLRAVRARERTDLVAAEAQARVRVAASEELAFLGVNEVWEQGGRLGVAEVQRDSRLELKREEKAGWVLARRAEKARLRLEAEARAEMCVAQERARLEVDADERRDLDNLVNDVRIMRAYYKEREAKRIEKQEAEEWKRRQEELRVEKEREKERQKQLREQARQEHERQRERERKESAERVARKGIERQEDSVREQLRELAGLSRRVAAAREALGHAEAARRRLWGTQLRLHLQCSAEAPRWNFLGEWAPVVPLMSECSLQRDLGPDDSAQRWRDADKRVSDGRERIQRELSEAAAALSARQRELAHALRPQLSDRADWVPPQQSSGKYQSGARGPGAKGGSGVSKAAPPPSRSPPMRAESPLSSPRADYQRAVDEALGDGAAVREWFDPSALTFPPDVNSEQLRTKKMHFQSVAVVVETGDTDFGALSATHCGSGHPAHDILSLEEPLPKGATVQASPALLQIDFVPSEGQSDVGCEAVAVALLACRYRSQAPVESNFHCVRTHRVRVTAHALQVPERGADPQDPLSAPCTVSAEAEMHMVVVPPLLYAPANSLKVTYEEDTPADRCVLLPQVAVSELPVVDHVGQMLVCRPGRDTDNGLLGLTLSLEFLSGATPADLVVLQRLHEDDIGCAGDGVGRVFTDGPRGAGPPFARIIQGGLLTHKEVEGRGEAPSNAQLPDSSGFTVEFDGGTVCRPGLVQRFLRRLRFVNVSQKPTSDLRVLELSMSCTGGVSSLQIEVEVVGQDDPAVFELAHKRLYYRRQASPDLPEELRRYLLPSVLPLFPGAKFYDIDTDRVRGGELLVQATGLQKGDAVCLRRGAHGTLCHVEGDSEVYWQGALVGRLVRGHAGLPAASVTNTPLSPTSPAGSDGAGAPMLPASVGAKPDKGARGGKKSAGMKFRQAGQAVGAMRRFRASISEEDDSALRVVFATDGSASVRMVQALLRSVVFTCTTYLPDIEARSVRTFEATVKLGPEFPQDRGSPPVSPPAPPPELQESDYQVLKQALEVRGAPEHIDIPGANFAMTYREGSGAQRVAPFEVVQDQPGFVENYNDGFLMAEVLGGKDDEDVLNLRAGSKDGDLRITLRKTADMHVPDINALNGAGGAVDDDDLGPPQASAVSSCEASPNGADSAAQGADSAAPEPGPEDGGALGALTIAAHLESPSAETPAPTPGDRQTSDTSQTLSPSERLRYQAQLAGQQRRMRLDTMLEKTQKGVTNMVKQGVDERTQSSSATVSDVAASSGKRIAVLVNQGARLYAKFNKKGVYRKEVMALLKSLTYANKSSKPEALNKIVRVTLRDSGFVATQVVLTVEIQEVDDVTDILVHNLRPRYRPGMLSVADLGCFAIAPLRRAVLSDPDTEFFDGGWLSVDIAGGGLKGDTLSLMTPAQQVKAREEAEEVATSLRYKRQRTSMHPGGAPTGTPTTPNPAALARDDATEGDMDIWDYPVYEGIIQLEAGKKVVTQDGVEVGTLENMKGKFDGCNGLRISFAKHSPKKVTIQLASYVLNCVCFEPKGGAPGQRTYNIRLSDGENPTDAKQRILIDVQRPLVSIPGPAERHAPPGETVTLFDKVQVALVGSDARGRDPLLQHGFTQLELGAGAPEGDTLLLSDKSGVVIKDGAVYLGGDFLGKLSFTGPQRLRIEHGWASKLSAKNLTALVQAMQFRSSSSGRTRTVELLCHDGGRAADGMDWSPSCLRLTVTS
eukprot:TRINITY_DN4589_c0_g2_i1.p1 TRINITY_DN4589_c0_g2~~TRINITY_DN4589_c0_g2_i1.p1  ORF type:complete len:2141 (+),score=666.84 TRINITY_DN4589_c0_g2_i1:93-6425(+)